MAVATFAAGTAVEPYPAGSVLDAQCATVWQNVTHDGAVLHAECAPHETPVAGELCPAWVHDQYVTTGPDGRTYATWHPIVDEQYGCGFDHEHGSDPRQFGDGTWLPAFGYVGNAAHHSESHFGHKLMAFQKIGYDPAGNALGTFDVMYHMHMGSTVQSRACVRYHEVNLVVANHATGEIVADLHWLGDFGEADIVADGVTTSIPLATCQGIHNPRGYEVDADGDISFPGYGERHLPVMEANGTSIGYEPWVINWDGPDDTLGVMLRGLSVNAHSSVTACTDRSCVAVQSMRDPLQRHGAFRSVVYTSNDRSRLGVYDIHGGDGHFTSNEFGDGPGVIPQYVKPGLQLEFRDAGRMYAQAPENGWYARGQPTTFGRPQFNPLRLLSDGPTGSGGAGN